MSELIRVPLRRFPPHGARRPVAAGVAGRLGPAGAARSRRRQVRDDVPGRRADVPDVDCVHGAVRPPGAIDLDPPAGPRSGRGPVQLAFPSHGLLARSTSTIPNCRRALRGRGTTGRRRNRSPGPTGCCRRRSSRSSPSRMPSPRSSGPRISGSRAIFLPTSVTRGPTSTRLDRWEPLWSAIEETGIVLGVPHRHGRRPGRVPRSRRRDHQLLGDHGPRSARGHPPRRVRRASTVTRTSTC